MNFVCNHVIIVAVHIDNTIRADGQNKTCAVFAPGLDMSWPTFLGSGLGDVHRQWDTPKPAAGDNLINLLTKEAGCIATQPCPCLVHYFQLQARAPYTNAALKIVPQRTIGVGSQRKYLPRFARMRSANTACTEWCTYLQHQGSVFNAIPQVWIVSYKNLGYSER